MRGGAFSCPVARRHAENAYSGDEASPLNSPVKRQQKQEANMRRDTCAALTAGILLCSSTVWSATTPVAELKANSATAIRNGEPLHRVFSIVEVEVQGRTCQVRATESPRGAEPFLGAIPVEERDWYISARERQLLATPTALDRPPLPLCGTMRSARQSWRGTCWAERALSAAGAAMGTSCCQVENRNRNSAIKNARRRWFLSPPEPAMGSRSGRLMLHHEP